MPLAKKKINYKTTTMERKKMNQPVRFSFAMIVALVFLQQTPKW